MRPFWRSLLTDDRAQATVEYILMLAVAVGLFLMVWRKLLHPIANAIINQLNTSLTAMFQSGEGLHHSPFPPPNSN